MKQGILHQTVENNNSTSVYKHEVPSSREWTNSIYSYNKNYVKNLPQKDNYLYKLIKTYLHLIPTVRASTKSKRLRDSLSRNSSKQVFISKPEIKQNSDKINIVLYLYDRDIKINNKKAFHLNNMLNAAFNNIANTGYSKVVPNRKFTRTINMKKKLSNRFDIYNNKYNSFLYKSMVNSKSIINNLFTYNFLRWSLSGFGYNIYTVRNHSSYILHITKTINKKVEFDRSYKFNLRNNNLNITSLLNINKILITYLHVILNNNSISSTENINMMLDYYSNKYSNKYVNRYMRKQLLAVKNIYKAHINKIKLGKLALGLKLLVQNIYSKKVELNFVNLKYLHLNSDTLTEAISIKLRSKNNNILSIFKKAISLVKMPRINTVKFLPNDMNLIDKFKLFNISSIINNNTLNKVGGINNKDTLSLVIQNMFPYKSLNFLSKFNYLSISNLLNSLYYKWVTGIRLEGKGRLTRRFTASRSVFKYKYRGSLKNLEHLNVPYFRKNTLNNMMIRNQNKSNIQYAFASNKKRVGVYGIKGWISNN